MEKISPLDLTPILSKIVSEPSSTKKNEEPSFSDIIKESIHKVDQSQKEADQTLQDFMAQKNKDLHHVMIAWEKADVSLQLLMKIRSKVLDAYQDVMRMPV